MGRYGLGEFEQRVLMAVHHLHGQGHAVTIAAHLGERTGRAPNLGAIYATLERLEKKGLAASRLGDPTPERGGRAKRLFRIEAPGVRALMEARQTDGRMWEGLPPLGAPT